VWSDLALCKKPFQENKIEAYNFQVEKNFLQPKQIDSALHRRIACAGSVATRSTL
jgi:hypothetical protein